MKLKMFAFVIACALGAGCASGGAPVVGESLDISRVEAGFPVGFCLLTHGKLQYVAYYDEQHRMTVASRTLDSKTWKYQILPSKVGWDSHNTVTMAIDDDGYIHLSGNMHCVPLIYFRTSKPGDIASFQRIKAMTGKNERRCTYPHFMRGGAGEFIFHYRDGGSGNGNEIYNVYDCKTKTWRKLLDKPLTDGRGKMNAYMHGPKLGPDGYFHMTWMWRDTPDCRTNHDISYARTKDLINWETVAGKPIKLPISLKETKGVIVDPVPSGGGIINVTGWAGFDSKKRVVVSYHKFDAKGNIQAYVARFESGKWKISCVTKWDYRWNFHGNGSINVEIRVGTVIPAGDGKLHLPYRHVKYGGGMLVIDEETLKPLGGVAKRQKSSIPAAIRKRESKFKGIGVRTAGDSGASGQAGVRYILRWETLGRHRDRKPKGPLPEPSMLRLIKIVER
ncbi:MAG: BNR repeat-containing protein [Phycisphaerae bacterium]|jgi:hypothetical protein|nr:BNR repeat-containing protein [Phycisphaerae bacterium]